MTRLTNRLANETSPYLQQHADNPVNWYPWGEHALQEARDQEKPILLSIGYSACHWCHVMAHESFEDEETAKLMNDLYINIKIDREERPDLDKIYQTAQALLTQRSGGWPLTMFLTPQDHVPFFGGTYFPKEPRHGLPAFKELLKRVEQYYRQNRFEIESQNLSLKSALAKIYGAQPSDVPLDPSAFERARHQLEQSFDTREGGFGSAPKFPHPTNIELLLRHWTRSQVENKPDQHALHMAIFTLKKMGLGGIYDHLGGGFCRYSVDEHWMIPHFEKMLYDNGPLLALYSQAAVACDSALFRRTAIETANWIEREMQSPEGGYYSTLDADSEGEEGKYYIWTPQEIKERLEPDAYALFARRFGLDRPPNFEGKWHLHGLVELDQLAREFDISEKEAAARIDRMRGELFQAREQRVRPGRDEKILTSWNGLMIKGMAAAARHLDAPEYADSATRALDFIRLTLWQGGRLLATYKDGRAHLNAYLDDYAFVIDAVLELLQARWESEDLTFACELAEVLLTHFQDKQYGGFYFTSDDHEPLIQRPKALADEATPSGNGVAATALGRLGHLVAEPRYLEAAERTLKHAAKATQESPMAHASLLIAMQEYFNPPEVLILRGRGDALIEWHRRCARDYAPCRMSLAIAAEEDDLPEALAEKAPQDEVVGYVCKGTTCSPPITNLDELATALARTSAALPNPDTP